MSVECSECERDLRSGHDKTCSRYRDEGICVCGHHYDRHDEELECMDCECDYFEKTGDAVVETG